MKITERRLRSIIRSVIKEQHLNEIHPGFLAIAANDMRKRASDSAARGRGPESPKDEKPNYAQYRSAGGLSPNEYQSDEAVRDMKGAMKKGRSKDFFYIDSYIDRYTRQETFYVAKEDRPGVDEEIIQSMIDFNESHGGQFDDKNYQKWIDEVCPILNHTMRREKLSDVWKSLGQKSSAGKESKLRQLIRKLMRET